MQEIPKPPPCPKLPKHLVKKPPPPDMVLKTPISEMPDAYFPKDRSKIPTPPKLPYKIPPLPKKPQEKPN